MKQKSRNLKMLKRREAETFFEVVVIQCEDVFNLVSGNCCHLKVLGWLICFVPNPDMTYKFVEEHFLLAGAIRALDNPKLTFGFVSVQFVSPELFFATGVGVFARDGEF